MCNRTPKRCSNQKPQVVLKVRVQDSLQFNITSSMMLKSSLHPIQPTSPSLSKSTRSVGLLPRAMRDSTLRKTAQLVEERPELQTRSKSSCVKCYQDPPPTTHHSRTFADDWKTVA